MGIFGLTNRISKRIHITFEIKNVIFYRQGNSGRGQCHFEINRQNHEPSYLTVIRGKAIYNRCTIYVAYSSLI